MVACMDDPPLSVYELDPHGVTPHRHEGEGPRFRRARSRSKLSSIPGDRHPAGPGGDDFGATGRAVADVGLRRLWGRGAAAPRAAPCRAGGSFVRPPRGGRGSRSSGDASRPGFGKDSPKAAGAWMRPIISLRTSFRTHPLRGLFSPGTHRRRELNDPARSRILPPRPDVRVAATGRDESRVYASPRGVCEGKEMNRRVFSRRGAGVGNRGGLDRVAPRDRLPRPEAPPSTPGERRCPNGPTRR